MNKKLITLILFVFIVIALVAGVLIFNNSKTNNSNIINNDSNNISQSNTNTEIETDSSKILITDFSKDGENYGVSEVEKDNQIVNDDKLNGKVEENKTIESESNNMTNKINLEIKGKKLTAILEENKSSKEFVEKLKEGSITINMYDYENFEKVGDLGFSISRSDKQIKVRSGDIVLYQGDKITIYYNDNSWNFTRLGHIDNISDIELENLLGSGNVSVTFSL